MNTELFDRELDAVLLQAAGSLALAREIEAELTGPGTVPERLWR